ncbi:MAG: type II CAAX prenyl endopeptidase Rce1 family protein [Pyrinomonadaceae bacterium]
MSDKKDREQFSRVAESNKEYRPSISDRAVAMWEILSVTSSFLIAAWLVVPFAANARWLIVVPVGLALGFIFVSHRARRETAREIGWRLDNFTEAARLLAVPMLAFACLIVLSVWLLGSLRTGKALGWQWALWLPVWGLAQQYVLQGFINRRAQVVCGGRNFRSVLCVAVIFTLLHAPNLWLMLATFAGGYVWAVVYQRAPNLLALGLSHSLMSLLLASAVPATTLNSLRIGFRFFG